MKASEAAAIRAIVSVHARYNRDRLLAALDAEIKREQASCPQVTPMRFEAGDGMMNTTKTGPAGNRSLTNPTEEES